MVGAALLVVGSYELDAVLGEGAPTLDDLRRLPYTFRVVKEVLRLYPAAPRFDREAIAADRLGEHEVRPGDLVSIWPWLLGILLVSRGRVALPTGAVPWLVLIALVLLWLLLKPRKRRFEFPAVGPGTYELGARLPGFRMPGVLRYIPMSPPENPARPTARRRVREVSARRKMSLLLLLELFCCCEF